MIDYRSDNTGRAAPEILEALVRANTGTALGFGKLCPGVAPVAPRLGQRDGPDRMLGDCVEQRPVRRRVEQAALLTLALQLDQAVAELAQ